MTTKIDANLLSDELNSKIIEIVREAKATYGHTVDTDGKITEHLVY